MHEETKLSTEIAQFFTKFSTYFIAVVFGLFGKVGMEIMMKKKYSLIQWVGVVLVSLFFGYLGSILCESYALESARHWLPSIMTIFGQNIAFYVVYNYKRIGDNLLYVFTKGRKE